MSSNSSNEPDKCNALNHSLNASDTASASKAVEPGEQTENTELSDTVKNEQFGTMNKFNTRKYKCFIRLQLLKELKYGKRPKFGCLLRNKEYSDLVERFRQELKLKLEKKGMDFNKIKQMTPIVPITPKMETTSTVESTATDPENLMKELLEKNTIRGKEQQNMQGNDEIGIESKPKAVEPIEQSANTESTQTVKVKAKQGKNRRRISKEKQLKRYIENQSRLKLKYGCSPTLSQTKRYNRLLEQCRRELEMKMENTGQEMEKETNQEIEKSTPLSVQSQKTPTTPSTGKVETTPTMQTTLKVHQNMEGSAVNFYEDVFDEMDIKKAERENSLAYSGIPKARKEVEMPATQGTTAKPIRENKTKDSARKPISVNPNQKSASGVAKASKQTTKSNIQASKQSTNPATKPTGAQKKITVKVTEAIVMPAIPQPRVAAINLSKGLPSGVPRNFLLKQVNMTSIEPQDPEAVKNQNLMSNRTLISITGKSTPNVDNGAYLQQLANQLFNKNRMSNPVNPPYPLMHQEHAPPAQYYPMMNQYPPEMPPIQPYPPLNYIQHPNPHAYQTPPMYDQAYAQHYPMPVAPVAPPNIPNPVLFQTPSTQQQNLAQHLPLQIDTAPVVQSSPSPNYQPQERQLMYSPSDAYAESKKENSADKETREGTESPDALKAGRKRLSAFQRLGPLTETKKPKLTINLLLKKEAAVREVLDEDGNSLKDAYVPLHLRPEILNSKNPVVMKYLSTWPWKKNFAPKRVSSARLSKSAMIVELEQMEEIYLKDNWYFQITVKGYPPTWTKQNVLDAILNAVKGKSFIPCFIEFKKEECIFLVIKSYTALVALHKMFFVIPSKEAELHISIGHLMLNTNHLNLIPRLVIETIIMAGYDNESTLNLKAFTLEEDVSHFVYFPLSRLANQVEMMQIARSISWVYITDLDLSSNRLTTIDGFDLTHNCPKLKHLDLSDNWFSRISALLGIRSLALRSIKLEGNPLCHVYIDPDRYVAVLRTAFSTLREIDGVPIKLSGDLPPFTRTYCPVQSVPFVDKFLSVYFPLIDCAPADRNLMENLYHEDAVLTITYREKLRSQPIYRKFRNLFVRARVLAADAESVRGAAAVARHHARLPPARHDPAVFAHDVLLHTEDVLVLKVMGVLKLTAETLAEDEHLIAFSRTFVLKTNDGVLYKIVNEMLYWDEPTPEYANNAFKVTTLKNKPIRLKLEGTPDDDLKEKIVELFMKLTNLKKGPSYKCLEMKDWNFKVALQLFFKLLKLDNLSSLLSENDSSLPAKK